MDNNEQQVQQLQSQRQYQLLSPEGQKILSVLQTKSDLPLEVESDINDALNEIAPHFLSKIRYALQTLIFEDNGDEDDEDDEHEVRGDTSLVKTVVNKVEEKQYETAIRLFPDVLSEKRHGFYPIQWMVGRSYNLRNVSLIPLVVEMGIELQQFDEELRGGLLCYVENDEGIASKWNVLQNIMCYCRNEKDNNNKLLDDCFLTVIKRLKGNNRLIKEDIRQYNLVGGLFSTDTGCFSETRFRYIVDWDPTPLSESCDSRNGTWLPIHWAVCNYVDNKIKDKDEDEDEDEDDLDNDRQQFSSCIKAGMQYFPDKFGFVFCKFTQVVTVPLEFKDIYDNDDKFCRREITGTPFQLACMRFGRDAGTKIVLDCISNHCANAAATTATATASVVVANAPATCTESNMLLSAVTDETIHLDGLFILIRKDPTTALLRLQQKLLLLDGQTDGGNSTAAATFNSTATTTTTSLSDITSSCCINNNYENTSNTAQSLSSKGEKKRKHGNEDDTNNNDRTSSIFKQMKERYGRV
jgi:hypothetical protein